MEFWFITVAIFACWAQVSVVHSHRIAIGSCYNPNKGSKILEVIEQFSPNQLVLLGDNVYMDKLPLSIDTENNDSGEESSLKASMRKLKTMIGFQGFSFSAPVTPEIIKTEYDKLTNNSEWRSLIRSLQGVSVTWDDHDYGMNNGDVTNVHRNLSLDMFHEFIRVTNQLLPAPYNEEGNAQRLHSDGVYSSRLVKLDDADDLVYKVVLMDSRFHKNPKGTENGDFLGPRQWKWLTDELLDPEPHFILLGSSIVLTPDDKMLEETWAEFPAARERLLKLISFTSLLNGNRPVVIMSGDIHGAEFSQGSCKCQTSITTGSMESPSPSSPYPSSSSSSSSRPFEVKLVELTSSGLSHSFSQTTIPPTQESIAIYREKYHREQKGEQDRTETLQSMLPPVHVESKGKLIDFLIAVYIASYPAHYRQFKYADNYQGVHFALLDVKTSVTVIDDKSTTSVANDCSIPVATTQGSCTIDANGRSDESSAARLLQLHFRVIDEAGTTVIDRKLPEYTIDMSNRVGPTPGALAVYRGKTLPELKKELLIMLEEGECECAGYWGPVARWRSFLYRFTLALMIMVCVVAPIVTALWFVFASCWYISIGAELARRDRVEQNYQKVMRERNRRGDIIEQ